MSNWNLSEMKRKSVTSLMLLMLQFLRWTEVLLRNTKPFFFWYRMHFAGKRIHYKWNVMVLCESLVCGENLILTFTDTKWIARAQVNRIGVKASFMFECQMLCVLCIWCVSSPTFRRSAFSLTFDQIHWNQKGRQCV